MKATTLITTDLGVIKFKKTITTYMNNHIQDGFVQPCFSGPRARYKV
jgi:hypothetical protein